MADGSSATRSLYESGNTRIESAAIAITTAVCRRGRRQPNGSIQSRYCAENTLFVASRAMTTATRKAKRVARSGRPSTRRSDRKRRAARIETIATPATSSTVSRCRRTSRPGAVIWSDWKP